VVWVISCIRTVKILLDWIISGNHHFDTKLAAPTNVLGVSIKLPTHCINRKTFIGPTVLIESLKVKHLNELLVTASHEDFTTILASVSIFGSLGVWIPESLQNKPIKLLGGRSKIHRKGLSQYANYKFIGNH
jgi:hypothetical protein